MLIHYGFDIQLEFFQPAELVLLLDIHPDLRAAIIRETAFDSQKASGTIRLFTDSFGNRAQRISIPSGLVRLQCDGLVRVSRAHDVMPPSHPRLPVGVLPDNLLEYLMPSRYCDSDLISDFAWSRFGHIEDGAKLVREICNFTHQTLRFDYGAADPTRTAARSLQDGVGVCRDFAHLAVALCRCMNIPARYCNGYLGDIGVPENPAPMDFNAWFEVWVNGDWYTFDARHNEPRIGRVLISRGRDAADVAMISSFGRHTLQHFTVITEEMPPADEPLSH